MSLLYRRGVTLEWFWIDKADVVECRFHDVLKMSNLGEVPDVIPVNA